MVVRGLLRRVVAFKQEAGGILGTHETSPARLITVEQTYEKLQILSVKQDDLFRQSLRAAELGLYRSAIVMSWAGFMDFLEEKLGEGSFAALNREYADWKIASAEDLRDIGSDFQIIGAARKVGLCSKTGEKALKGLLNRRNEAAHPSDYYPGLNEALGYISETIQRVEKLQPMKPK